MDDEEQPLLETGINHVEPVADDQPFDNPRRSRLSTLWRQVRRLDSPISDWFLYPIFWLHLWALLTTRSFEGVCYRPSCKVCRKKSGTVDQLLASSKNGCHHCELYVEALDSMAPQIQPEVGMFTLKSDWWLKKFPLEIRFWNVGGFETARFRFLAPRVCHQETSIYPGGFNVPQSSASDETMHFAVRNVEECVRGHKLCQKPKRPSLPRRVVDVCDFNIANDVKLYESHGERKKYIALSHTWGQKHTFMTKESNLAELKQGIKLQSLPKTFQDAIFMARRLRIRYVWIDSLCIIQDDLADWEEESPKMGAVYGNAYLTIAAGSALNDQTGFLGSRSDLMYRDFPLRTRIRQCIAICRVQDMTAPDRRDPLSFRAWAFQERLLSRRTLYYHQQELVYECSEGLKCECMSCSRVVERYRQDRSASWDHLGVSYVSRSFPRVEIPVSASTEDLQHFWRRFIVPEYSARSISRDSDRLPALSSAASAVQSLSKDMYLAGMWYLSLPADLAWTTVHNSRSRTGERILATLPVIYVAPSWCWASINGPVQYRYTDVNENIIYQVSILNIECAFLGSNSFGSVESGYITLSGKTLHGTCELHVDPDKLWPYRVKLFFPTPNQMTLGFEPDVAFLVENEASHQKINSQVTLPEPLLNIDNTLRRGRAPAGSEDRRWERSGDRLSYGRIRCLLLYTVVQPTRCEWVFMALSQSSQSPGICERLGMLTCWVNGDTQWPELDGVNPQVVTIG